MREKNCRVAWVAAEGVGGTLVASVFSYFRACPSKFISALQESVNFPGLPGRWVKSQNGLSISGRRESQNEIRKYGAHT
jgi:hypothetical protein